MGLEGARQQSQQPQQPQPQEVAESAPPHFPRRVVLRAILRTARDIAQVC